MVNFTLLEVVLYLLNLDLYSFLFVGAQIRSCMLLLLVKQIKRQEPFVSFVVCRMCVYMLCFIVFSLISAIMISYVFDNAT